MVRKPEIPQYNQAHVDAIDRVRMARSDTEMLDLPTKPSREDVKKAYRTLVGMINPDKNRAPGSEDAFKALV